MRVKFLRDYTYTPSELKAKVYATAYKAGDIYTVRRECAEAAIRAGAAVEEKPAKRDETSD